MTRPTTIKAMTETPANTPSPMGNTSSFWPGVVAAASCAAAAEGVMIEVDICPFDKVVTDVTGVVTDAVSVLDEGAGWTVPVADVGI